MDTVSVVYSPVYTILLYAMGGGGGKQRFLSKTLKIPLYSTSFLNFMEYSIIRKTILLEYYFF
jgi:hypothetical protein